MDAGHPRAFLRALGTRAHPEHVSLARGGSYHARVHGGGQASRRPADRRIVDAARHVHRGSGRVAGRTHTERGGGHGEGPRHPVRARSGPRCRRSPRRRTRPGSGRHAAGHPGRRAAPGARIHSARRYHRDPAGNRREGGDEPVNGEERQALHDAVVSACGGLDAGGWHSQAWKALDQIGVRSLSVSEAAGGAGADLGAATVVLLALGSLGASVPVVETGLMAGWLMERAGGRLPDGIVTAAVGDRLQVHSEDGEWMVSGTLTRVPWARHADYAVVLSHAGAGPCVAVVPLAGAELRRGANVAGEPRDDVVLSSVAVDVYALDGPE